MAECKKARFMNNNVACAIQSTITASSETSGFGVSNLKDVRRTKVWKAAGNFEIYSTNNTIYIDDGSPINGTIPSGSYNGTTLATAVALVLNTISTGWTVSYNTTTYLFSINHATATVQFSLTTDSIWNTLGYTGILDVIPNGTAYASNEIRIHNFEYIDIDLNTSAFAIGFLGFIGSVGDTLSISKNAVVKILADNVPITFDIVQPVDITLTYDDRGYLQFFDAIADTNYRYWRILIQDETNGNGPTSVSMGYLYLGTYITFVTTNIARGFDKELIDPSSIQETNTGRRFFNKRNIYNALNNLQIQLPCRAERLEFEQFVYDFGLAEPFFISLDPGTNISDALSELTYLVNFSSLPNFGHRFVDLYDIQPFSVREVV